MTKVKYLMVLVVIALVMGSAGCGKKKNMNYEGFYSNKDDINSVHIFFRFYPDGVVTAAVPVPVNNEYTLDLKELDKKDTKKCTVRGNYILKGNKVTFKLTDKNGSVDFAGDMQENKMTLKSHSAINGKDSVEAYRFFPQKW